MTQVVKFQDVKAHWNAKLQRWDSEEYVYIGRPNAYYNLPGSQWGNYPDKGIEFYRQWIQEQPQFRQIEELRGKTLVCWCKPSACHGDALLELLGEAPGAPPPKAISLWQPWASLCVLGLKQYETRHWSTAYRGTLVIHAAKRWTEEERETLLAFDDLFGIVGDGSPLSALWTDKRLFGAALGTVELTAIYSTNNPGMDRILSERETAFGNYAPDRYAWKLENPRLFAEPIPYRGQQGMWTWDVPLPDEIYVRA